MTRKKMLLIAGMVFVGAGILLGAAAPKRIAWSSTPQFCNSCHVMNDQYEAWFKTGVHRTIQCIDCHLLDPLELTFKKPNLEKGLEMIGKKDPSRQELRILACADCHMPFTRTGGYKISDHDVTSPLNADLRAGYGTATCARLFETLHQAQAKGAAVDKTVYQEAKDLCMQACQQLKGVGQPVSLQGDVMISGGPQWISRS